MCPVWEVMQDAHRLLSVALEDVALHWVHKAMGDLLKRPLFGDASEPEQGPDAVTLAAIQSCARDPTALGCHAHGSTPQLVVHLAPHA